MNGILCIDKPAGFTSFDVVAKMRGITRVKRIGHSGTLDPMATGVLPLFFGGATKACDRIPDDDKRYTAGFLLGMRTDTQDSTGKILAENKQVRVTAAQIADKLTAFTGEILQVPPMFSAVQIGGKRLYDLARQGIEIERPARAINIYEFALRSFDEPSQTGTLDISCSKGTYIRTLIDDLGQALGCGGVMTSLVRTYACGFSLEQCITLEKAKELAERSALEPLLLPVYTVFATLPSIQLDEVQSPMFRNGVKLDTGRMRFQDRGQGVMYAVYAHDGGFLGLAYVDEENKELRIEKLFV